MTLHELSQLVWLKKEVELNRERLGEVGAKLSARTSQISNDTVVARSVNDRTGEVVAELILLKEEIERQEKRCVEEQIRLESYISSIDDSLTRQIFVCRFVRGMTWRKVARVIGGGNSAEAVKKRCQRWLKNH